MISPALSKLVSVLRALLAAVLLIALGGVFYFIFAVERRWIPPAQILSAKDAFFHGTIGTELMPLPVAVVLPDLFPELFQPFKDVKGDWIDQFGFIRPSDFPDQVQVSDKDLADLPLGWTASNYRQRSGAPSPVKFVGFTCVMCHSTVLRQSDDQKGHLVIGPGNASLNFFAYLDAFQASILNEQRLTVAGITEAYHKKTGIELNPWQKTMIRLWLMQIRKALRDSTQKFDDGPFGGEDSMWARRVPTGPGRTQPFRTLIRNLLGRPGTTMAVYTKVAPIYDQALEEWSQVDGSIRGLQTRSAGAAVAAGATPDNLAIVEIARNVTLATQFTLDLKGPTYKDLFPDLAAQLDLEKVKRGREIYVKNCMSCHGIPGEAGRWIKGERQEQLVNVGTDPERVIFPHRFEMTEALYNSFPKDHPFHTERDDIRPTAPEEAGNYINKPIPFAFTRGRFIHNGSVPTIAHLINLETRPDVFYCGNSLYDPQRLGFLSPAAGDVEPKGAKPSNAMADDRLKSHDIHAYFRFDTSWRGNSNRGHDFPWPREEALHHLDELQALLEFMKTI